METQTFAEQLKADTRIDHESVDNLVMSVNPFANAENYGKFLQLQAVFHKAVDPIYHDQELNKFIPNLADMARYQAVLKDIQDVGTHEPQLDEPISAPDNANKAIGWLYCAEGSNIGAAFLFKEVQKIEFDDEHGASHLAPHADGRGKHWREFVKKLNELPLDEAARKEAVEGAKEAFAAYKVALRQVFGLPKNQEARA